MNFLTNLSSIFSGAMATKTLSWSSILGSTTTVSNELSGMDVLALLASFASEIIFRFFYVIVSFLFNVLDIIQMAIYRMMGIGTLFEDDYVVFDDSNPLIKLLTSEAAINAFITFCIVAIVLIIGFTIFAIIVSEYKAAADNGENTKTRILGRSLRSFLMLSLFPAIFVAGVLLVNALLAGFNNAFYTEMGQTASFGNTVFVSSTVDANRYRIYADKGLRVPILFDFNDPYANTKNMGAYTTDELLLIYEGFEDTGKGLYEDFANGKFTRFNDTLVYDKATKSVYNKASYAGFEKFLCTAEQYYVMADFVEYAFMNNIDFHIKSIKDEDIEWKYVDEAIFDKANTKLTITYKDAGDLAEGTSYTVTYVPTSSDVTTPISDAFDTISNILGIGKYEGNEFDILSRDDDSINLVFWETDKVLVKFSKDYKTNPTYTDLMILYEYYRWDYNNTLDYELEELEEGVYLPALEYKRREWRSDLRDYKTTDTDTVVLINGNYYKVVKTNDGDSKNNLEAFYDGVYELKDGFNDYYYTLIPLMVNQSSLDPVLSDVDMSGSATIGEGNSIFADALGKYINYQKGKTFEDVRVIKNNGSVEHVVEDPETGLEITTYSFYDDTVTKINKQVNWPEKLMNDMRTIYSDINVNLLITSGDWLTKLSEIVGGTSMDGAYGNATDGYGQTFDTSIIHPLGLIISELFLNEICESNEVYYGDYQFKSSLSEDDIRALLLAISGEDNYKQLSKQVEYFVELFNAYMVPVLEDIAYYENFELADGEGYSEQLYTYKAYLCSLLLSSSCAKYLFEATIAVVGASEFAYDILECSDVVKELYTGFEVDDDGYYKTALGTVINGFAGSLVQGVKNTTNADLENEIKNGKLINFDGDPANDILPSTTDARNPFAPIYVNVVVASDEYAKAYGEGKIENYIVPEGEYAYDEFCSTFQKISEFEIADDGRKFGTGETFDALTSSAIREAIENKFNFKEVDDYSKIDAIIDRILNRVIVVVESGTVSRVDKVVSSVYRTLDELNMIFNNDSDYPDGYYETFLNHETEGIYQKLLLELAASNSSIDNPDFEYIKVLGDYISGNINRWSNVKKADLSSGYSLVGSYGKLQAMLTRGVSDMASLDYQFSHIEKHLGYTNSVFMSLQELYEDLKQMEDNGHEIMFTELPDIEPFELARRIDAILRKFGIAPGILDVKTWLLAKKYDYIVEHISELMSLANSKDSQLVKVEMVTKYSEEENIAIVNMDGSVVSLYVDNDVIKWKEGSDRSKIIFRDSLEFDCLPEIRNERYYNINNVEIVDSDTIKIGSKEYYWDGKILSGIEEVERSLKEISTLLDAYADLIGGFEVSNFKDESFGATHAADVEEYLNAISTLNNVSYKIDEYLDNLGKYDVLTKYYITYAVSSYVSTHLSTEFEVVVNNKHYTVGSNFTSAKLAEYVLGGKFLSSFGYGLAFVDEDYEGFIDISASVNSELKYYTFGSGDVNGVFSYIRDFICDFGDASVKIYNMSNFGKLTPNTIDEIVIADNPDLAEYMLRYLLDGDYMTWDSIMARFGISVSTIDINGDGVVTLGGGSDAEFSTDLDGDGDVDEDDLHEHISYLAYEKIMQEKAATTATSNKIGELFEVVYQGLFISEGNNISLMKMTLKDLRLKATMYLADYEQLASETTEQNQKRFLALFGLSCADWVQNEDMATQVNSILSSQGAELITIYDNDYKAVEAETITGLSVHTGSQGIVLKLAGIENRPYEELVGLEYNIDFELAVQDEANGDIFVICTYDNEIHRYIPFMMTNKTDAVGDSLREVETIDGTETWLSRYNYKNAVTDYYTHVGGGGAEVFFPVVARGVFDSKGNPTAIRKVKGNVEFYREDVVIRSASKIGLEKYYLELDEIKIKGGLSGRIIDSISRAISGKTLTQHLTESLPRLQTTAYINLPYGVDSTVIDSTADEGIRITYTFGGKQLMLDSIYDTDMINMFLLFLCAIILFMFVFKAFWGVIGRMFDITILFILGPIAISTVALKSDKKEKDGNYKENDKGIEGIYDQWKKKLIDRLLIAFGYIFGLNIFFVLAPMVKGVRLFSSAEAFAQVPLLNNVPLVFINMLGMLIILMALSSMISYAPQLFSKVMVIDDATAYGDKIKQAAKNVINEAKDTISGQRLVDAAAEFKESAKKIIPGYEVYKHMKDKKKELTDKAKMKAMEAAALAGGAKGEVAKAALEAYKKAEEKKKKNQEAREKEKAAERSKRQADRDSDWGVH